MTNTRKESKVQLLQDLTAVQVAEIVKATGRNREEVAELLGCGTSQLFKYEKEGLPPRMNREVRAAILQLGIETQVLPANAAMRTTISKLAKTTTSQARRFPLQSSQAPVPLEAPGNRMAK